MPWQPLPHIAFAVATYPFAASYPEDLVLEIGDELYIIEETPDGNWLRGYLLKPPSLLAGLTSVKGQTLEARVFSGIFPRSCVEVRELLGESDDSDDAYADEDGDGAATSDDGAAYPAAHAPAQRGSDSAKSGVVGGQRRKKKSGKDLVLPMTNGSGDGAKNSRPSSSRSRPATSISAHGHLSVPVLRDPNAPKPQAPVPMLKIGDETPTSAAEPLIDEIASCLREWHSTNLHELLLSRQYHKLDILSQLITSLNQARQQFLHNVLTSWEYTKLREKTVWDLVRVNKLCAGEVIVRDPAERGRILTSDDSVVEITQLQSVMSLLNEPPQPLVEPTALHHLLVDVKGFAGACTEGTSLVLGLMGRAGDKLVRLSESFTTAVPSGMMGHLFNRASMRTLFSDLSSADIGEAPALDSDLFLVVAVRSVQQIAMAGQPHQGKPSSRSGAGSAGHGGPLSSSGTGSKDTSRPPLSSGNKSVRRSLMWGGKSTRTAFSRSGNTPKLDALNEMSDERPGTGSGSTPASRDGYPAPPSTAGSRSGSRAQFDTTMRVTADRVTGIGVLKLNAIMKRQDDDVEHVINIWAPSSRAGAAAERQLGEDWEPFIKDLMLSKTGQFEKSRGAERVQVHLHAFNHPDADSLIKATPTLLSGIVKTSKMGFSGAPTKPRSDIYLTVNDAVLSRQVLLSRYGTSPGPLPSSLKGDNLQVTLEVRRSTGDRIDGCIFPYSNSEGLSTWRSTAVERDDGWRQTLRLSLAPPDVSSAHVVMFVADMPNPPFAVAYMPLWDQAAFVRDGSHGLVMYRIDENTVSPRPPPGGAPGRGGGYLSLPWSTKGRVENQTVVTGVLANLRVDSYLCSTRFSQDRVVLGLLKWREGPKDAVTGLLQQLIFVPEIEVVKLLSEVLDALFAILVEYSGNDEYEDLVFTALVRVLDIVHDRRFNVGPLVDHYAENKFNSPFATPCLVRSFTRLLSKPTEPEISRKLRATFKVVRHILKFITHARDQQRVKEAGIGITSTTPNFTRHIQSIFKALEAMMRNTAPVLVGSQTLAVQHFHTWLPELAGLLSTEEILHIAIDFMDACANVKGKLVLYKLVLIINYSRLDIFAHPEQRSALSANTVRWIAPHWGHSEEVTDQWKDQVRLCCSILASQIDHLGPEIPDYIPKILDSYLAIKHAAETAPDAPKAARTRLSLLFPTQYPFPSRPIVFPEGKTEPALEGKLLLGEQPLPPQFDEALVELSAVLSALSNSSSGMQLEMADGDLAVIIENTLRVHMSILRGEAFPSTWLSVHIFHHNSIMRTLQYLANILLESFLLDPDEAEEFNTELWKMLFSTLLMLVSSPSLALETFPEQKRRAVWKIAGDVREHGAELLRRTWEAIGWDTAPDERQRYNLTKMGGYQVQYVPALVGPIVELCLSVHEGLRRMAVEVLQTMIVSEWTLSEDLSIIQAEIIDYLDHYFKTKPLTESILQKLFVGELLDRFAGLADIPDEPLYAALRELIGTIDEFLDLLVAVHGSDGGGVSDVAVTGSGSPGEASHLINRLRLMEFLRDMQKEEMFVRYVHQLAALQAASRNNAEAGLALRLHAELYDWDPLRTVPALSDPPFPAQTHFERKERIYFDMIKHFEDGEAWSSALAAYKELQVQYETNVYDFSKLARTERAIATVYETITKSDRLVPKYFHVVFRGLGFPSSVRDKEFVYEGSPNERTGAFTDRMQEQYPAAQIVVVSSATAANSRIGGGGSGGVGGSGAGSTEDMLDDIVEGQFLVVSALNPHRDFSHHVFQRARVPQVIRDYLVSSHPQTFSFTSRRHLSGPVTEHFVSKTVYTTAEPFPTILRRSEIVSMGEARLSAKEAALERTLRKTAEIATVEKKVIDGDNSPDTVKLLLDAISISVNPSSENSIVGYRQLLPAARSNGQNSGEGESGEGSVSEDAEDAEDSEAPELDSQEIAIKMALVDHAMVVKRSLALVARSTNESFSSYAGGLTKYFEETFAPEIAVFAPPPVPRDGLSASPTWSRPSPTESSGPHRPTEAGSALEHGGSSSGGLGISSANAGAGAGAGSGADVAIEEGAAVQPVALRPGRGARLSFLPGGNGHWKRDSVRLSNSENVPEQAQRKGSKSSVPGADADTMSDNSRRSQSRSKENGTGGGNGNGNGNGSGNRHSFFRPSTERTPRLPVTETTVTAAAATVVAASRSSNSLQRQTTSGSSSGGGNKMNDWFADSSLRRSLDIGASSDRKRSAVVTETSHHVAGDGSLSSGGNGGGLAKKSSVRKRLSLLKLGKKSSKGNGIMVAVDEE